MAKSSGGRRSILGRLTNLAIGTALTAVELVDDGLAAVADANRRVWETVDRGRAAGKAARRNGGNGRREEAGERGHRSRRAGGRHAGSAGAAG